MGRCMVLTMVLALASLVGCAPAPRSAADARAPGTEDDVVQAMRRELAHTITLDEDNLVAINDALSQPAETFLTSGVVDAPAPMPLPDDRMSLSAAAPQPPVATWGATASATSP